MTYQTSWKWPRPLACLALAALCGCHQVPPGALNFDPDELASQGQPAGIHLKSARLTVASKEPLKELAAIEKLEKKGRGPEAVYAYEQLIAEGKATATVYQRLAILLDRQGMFDRSSKYFLAALKAAPDNAEILCDYGYSRFVQGDLGTAESSLRRAIELNPDLPRANNNLALILARTARTEEALKHFQLAGADAVQAERNLQRAVDAHQNESLLATADQDAGAAR